MARKVSRVSTSFQQLEISTSKDLELAGSKRVLSKDVLMEAG